MPHDHSFVIGERIPGTKYVLCGVLGKGGMGTVYEVVKEPGIRGAMKVMHPTMVARPDCVARFFDEVRLLAKLRHKNIVAVYDFDTLGDGTPYLVMEKLEGETLRSTLRKSARSKQGFPARGAYEVIRQTCEGLYRAHTRSSPVVHRDIKPENLFLNQLPGSDEVAVKVLDFGVAALVDSNGARGQFGTPKYMAPEQFRGEPATPSSDLYAVALVLYEMLTGRLPWDAETDVDVCRAHMSLDPAPPSRFAPWVPKSIDELVLRGLARDQVQRLHSVFAFASQLYELQWVDDGHSRVQDVNTTAPTLPALVAAFEEDRVELASGSSGHDTFRGMTPPPIEGASLEIIPYDDTVMPRETIQVESPRFSPASIARAMAGSTKIPPSKPSFDRSASTPEMLPLTRPVPKYDTEPISELPPLSPAFSREQSSPRLPIPPAKPAATPLAGAVDSAASRAPKSMDRALQFAPYAVFFAIVGVGTTMSAMATRGLARPAATAQRFDVSSVITRTPVSAAKQVAVVPEVTSAPAAPAAVSSVQPGVDASAGPARAARKTMRSLVATAPQTVTARDAGRAPEPFLEWGQEP
jgi:eukaryotic-like serine/threonine-protein kinase